MRHEEGFLNENSNEHIYYQCWLPEGDLKAVLLVVHGLAEHCGRYMNVVNHFVPLGYGIYGFDFPGHGKSHGKRVYVNRREANRITLPILLLQGGADKLVDPDGAGMLFETVQSTDKTLKTYDGLYHEIFNEPERDQVLGHMEQWLENHTH